MMFEFPHFWLELIRWNAPPVYCLQIWTICANGFSYLKLRPICTPVIQPAPDRFHTPHPAKTRVQFSRIALTELVNVYEKASVAV